MKSSRAYSFIYVLLFNYHTGLKRDKGGRKIFPWHMWALQTDTELLNLTLNNELALKKWLTKICLGL